MDEERRGEKGVPDIWLKCSKTWELDNTPGRVKIVQDMYIQFLMMTRWYNNSNSHSLDRKKQEPRTGVYMNNGN